MKYVLIKLNNLFGYNYFKLLLKGYYLAQLSDMEELLEQIENIEIKDYMREAMSCYYANAYRGCIVLCVIAMFDDLMRKLQELSYINGTATGIYKVLLAKQEDQDVFENDMLTQLCSNNIISKLEKDIFNNLKGLRNKSAHPSGHKPTAEEARYVYSEVISKVITQPLLKTIHLIEDILKKINNANFFYINTPDVIKSIVENEIINLHDDAYAMLIVKLTDEIKDAQLNDKKNYKLFLYGLALLNKTEISEKIYKKFIKNHIDNLELRAIIIPLFTKDNRMLEFLKDDLIIIGRLNSMIISKINSENGVGIIPNNSHAFFKENSELIIKFSLYDKFKTSLEKMFDKYEYSFPKELLIFEEMKNTIIDKYKNNAKSSMYTKSNKFVQEFAYVDSFLTLEPVDAYEICKNIKMAGDSCSFASKNYYNNYFNDFPNLKAKAKEYINSLDDESDIDADLLRKIVEDEDIATDESNS